MTSYAKRFPLNTLQGWITFGRFLCSNSYSSAPHVKRARDTLWEALDVRWIKTGATLAELDSLEAIFAVLRYQPRRGFRRDTKWEAVHCAVNNRRFILQRDADWESMGTGHNSRNHQQEVRP